MRRFALLVALVASCALGPASLAATTGQPTLSPDRARVDADRMLEGGLLGGLLVATELRGLDVAAQSVDGPPGVAMLTAAVRTAEQEARGAVQVKAGATGRVGERRSVGGTRVALPATGEAEVDEQALGNATAVLLLAVERSLPALQRLAAVTPAPAGPVDGCDLVDQAPALCVAGPGSNTIRKDYALVVELGGDDVHAHSAGAAQPVTALGRGNGLPVSLTVDVGGNDRYATAAPSGAGAETVQGAGFFGGVGVLIDAAGDDSYTATANPDPKVASQGANGQGFAVAGAGVLADLGGNDSYALSTRVRGDSPTATQGWGTAGEGIALFMDRGAGDDRYRADNAPVPRTNRAQPARFATVIVAGSSAAGLGAFLDDGGKDVQTAGARQSAEAHSPQDGVLAIAEGFGFAALGGLGLAVHGSGDSQRELRAGGPGAGGGAVVHGLGWGSLGGTGVLVDVGGADANTLGAAADFTTSGSFQTFGTLADGLGYASAGATGIVVDGGGNDMYRAHAISRVRSNGRGKNEVLSLGATVNAMGSATLGGLGHLVDGGGDDLYDAHAVTVARATGPGRGQLAQAGNALVVAQGAGQLGAGHLVDTGGLDRYSSFADATADAGAGKAEAGREVTATAGASLDSFPTAPDGFGSFVDVDGGAADVFSSSHPVPTCTGKRGEAAWTDCAGGAGVNR